MNPSSACPACGIETWKAERMEYRSHVNLDRVEEHTGIWSIGSDFVIKEKPQNNFDPAANEVPCMKFLQEHSTIPVPSIVKDWTDNDGVYFQFQRRIHGEDLEDAWSTLSPQAKAQIADEVAQYLAQLRQFQSRLISSFSGSSFSSNYLLPARDQKLHDPFDSDDSFFAELVDDLDLSVSERLELQNSLPPCAPYTLTLGQLSINNFLVRDGHLVGIMEWDTAGYFPVWWEYVRANVTHGPEDVEWKSMLRERIEQFPQGDEFFWELNSSEHLAKLGARGKLLLAALGLKA